MGLARRFATGDARNLKDAEALNLLHPLVQAAITDARAASLAGSIKLQLPPTASAGLAALAGKNGLLCVVLVDYAGFEPVQSLVAAAVVAGTPIDPSLAAEILRLPATKGPAIESAADVRSLDDAVEEAVFVDQRRIEEREHQHFEQAIGQLERYVEDKILVCRRERAGILENYAPHGLVVTKLSAPRPAIGLKRISSAWRTGKRLSTAVSRPWNPERTRFTKDGEENTTTFVTRRRG